MGFSNLETSTSPESCPQEFSQKLKSALLFTQVPKSGTVKTATMKNATSGHSESLFMNSALSKFPFKPIPSKNSSEN